MSKTYVYSFEDTTVQIDNPNHGSYTMYGAGLGDVSVSRANDITSHEVGADLSVLVSRSAKKNGTVTINVLQSSEANEWLNKLCVYLETCPIGEFAATVLDINNPSTGEFWHCTGVTPQKIPDRSYQAQGQMVQYTLMAAELALQ